MQIITQLRTTMFSNSSVMKFRILQVLALLGGVFASCVRNVESDKFSGPTAIVNFTATGLNADTADFSVLNQPIYYNSNFNQPAYWQVKIKGLQSGGVKIFAGYGTSVDITNTAWYGNSDSLFFFRAGEKCLVTLYVSGLKEPKIDTLLILNPRSFAPDRFYTINNFDDLTSSYPSYEGDTIDATQDPALKSILTIYPTDSVKLMQGTGVGYIGGDLQNATGKYLVGGIYLPVDLSLFPGGGANADSIFINIIAKSAGPPYGNRLTFQVQEVESEFKKHPEWTNQPGDIWAFDTPVLTKEWQVYSVRYSQLAKGYRTDGNLKHEPFKVNQANLGVVTSVEGGKVKCYVDFYVITYGKPLQP